MAKALKMAESDVGPLLALEKYNAVPVVYTADTVRPYLGENPECASGHMSGAVVDLVCSDQLS